MEKMESARLPARSVLDAMKHYQMRILLLACVCFSTTRVLAAATGEEYELGDGATIIETQPITPNRSLILWMVRPAKNPRDTSDDQYTCPEYTRGSYYSGATRVSLVDSQARKVINTVKVSSEPGADEFDIPYNIRPDYYYHVEGVLKEAEGKPTLMWLRDYNGDGRAWEFALFDAQACMGLATTLIGYSERQDRVIQYQTHLIVSEAKRKRTTTTEYWTDYLFSKKPASPGSWKFEIDYRGRGGSLDKYEVHYDKQTERFEGKLTQRGEE
jgi:hypothetical protein